VLAEIVERTDGIPLFVEEMTKAVLEAEGEGDACRTIAAVPSPALAVPASLHALRVQARQRRPRHAGLAALPRAQEHPTHGALYRAIGGSVQELLGLSSTAPRSGSVPPMKMSPIRGLQWAHE